MKVLKRKAGYDTEPPAKGVALGTGAGGADVEMEGANNKDAGSKKQKVD